MSHETNGNPTQNNPSKTLLERLGEDWQRRNQRRLSLIEKETREELTELEQEELEQLQNEVFDELERACPTPQPDSAALDRIEARLRGQAESPTE